MVSEGKARAYFKRFVSPSGHEDLDMYTFLRVQRRTGADRGVEGTSPHSGVRYSGKAVQLSVFLRSLLLPGANWPGDSKTLFFHCLAIL